MSTFWRAKTSKKYFDPNSGIACPSRGLNDLFCSKVVRRLVKRALFFDHRMNKYQYLVDDLLD